VLARKSCSLLLPSSSFTKPHVLHGVFHYAILLCLAVSNLSGSSGFRLDGGGCLATSSFRVLVVDDHKLFRQFICSTLGETSELQIIGEASDGPEAVQKAEELHPDLIVLDIGLPALNGIEATRRIRKLSPESKILFVSQESTGDVIREALGTGASGYVYKPDAGSELLEAVRTVLRGERFVGARFRGHDSVGGSDAIASRELPTEDACAPLQRNMEITHRHEAGFYPDDASLLDDFAQFIGPALKAGNSAIVVATESHRDGILLRLHAHGLDIGSAIEQGRYISVDAAETLSAFMVNGLPDPLRFFNVADSLLLNAAKAAKGESPRIVACGEGVALLWVQGNPEAAIRLEHLWNEMVKSYDVDVFCGYPLGSFHEQDNRIFQRICEEHSAIYCR